MARWLSRIPVFLLVVVALNQIYSARSEGLSPWSGGGFGMFSSLDAGAARHMHVVVLRPGLEREVEVPESLRDQARRALALPSDARLAAIGRALADQPAPDASPATGVRVQVWATRFDSQTLEPSGRLVHAVELSW